ncbi:unnamed protein product [Clonostachys rosea f. rosea IK726]|uniref:Uncharacterized protein n=1 Tax=Clonostachys rosea f. rosea IK726 TaxID=1349383 RepID=A0ACA9TPH0_BIOOC|nr:unnamed protein product [Clonostachys rosea f. rosea IK726]
MRLGSIGNIAAVLASVAVELASAVPQCATSQRLQRQSEGERLVFAHFMVGIVGSRASAAAYDDDMKRAKAAGIDAFALNIGTDDYSETQLNYAYESAANNDMKVFISFDFNWYNITEGTRVGKLVANYASKPAQLIVDNKVFVSSFAGDGVDSSAIREAAGREVFWAPNFHPGEADFSTVDAALNWMGWNNDGNNKAPKPGATVTIEDGDKSYAQALAGKPYVAPVSPWFFTHYGPEVDYSKNWVFQGDTLWYDRWQQILQLQPRFLEIVTWNDYGESHYVGRLDSPHGDDGNSKWVYGFPHNGWLDMAVPFISAYHDGASDATSYITENKIVYWFRPTRSDLDCDATDTTMEDANNSTGNYFKGRPDGWETMEDKVFIVTLLTEAGRLEVTAGGKTESFEAPKGPAKFSVDMAAGAVTFRLYNGDKVVLEGDAGMQILDYCPCGIYNFNPYVGTIPAGEPDELLPEGYASIMAGLKEELGENPIRMLPPVDKGTEAWKFLLGSFLIEAVLWGFPLCFGVFQNHYASTPKFGNDQNIPVIGTLATSLQFLGAPFAAPFVKRFGRWRQHMVIFGSAICVVSLVLASFVNTVVGLIWTQGVLYGVGFLILYMPVVSMLNEWFVHRRGFAYGILYAGGGINGVGLPFLLEWLLTKWGYPSTLRIMAVAQFVLVAPMLPFLKGRLPHSHHSVLQPIDLKFFRAPLFWVFGLSNLCQGLAYYIPSIAAAIGLSGTVGALILAANNLASAVGLLSFGHLTDRFKNIYLLIFISTAVSAVASFGLWGYSHSLVSLLMFSIIYGWSAGAYAVFWPKFGSIISEDPQPVYSMMSFGKGIGNIVTGPISAMLVTRPVQLSAYGLGRFEPAIIFVGSLMLCSSLGIIGWPLKQYLVRSR